MVTNQEIYCSQEPRTDYLEIPIVQITVKIQLKLKASTILRALNQDLAPDNMEASANGSTITVKGILPEPGYGAQNILDAVKKYDRRASIIP